MSEFPLILISTKGGHLEDPDEVKYHVIETKATEFRYHVHVFFRILFYEMEFSNNVVDIHETTIIKRENEVPMKPKRDASKGKGFLYYVDNFESILQKYDNMWIAVNGEEVIAYDDSIDLDTYMISNKKSGYYIFHVGSDDSL